MRTARAFGPACLALASACSPPPSAPAGPLASSAGAASPASSTPSRSTAPIGTTPLRPDIESAEWSPDGRYVVLEGAIVDVDANEVSPSGCTRNVAWGSASRFACKAGAERVEIVDMATVRRASVEGCESAEPEWDRSGRYLGCPGSPWVFDAEAFRQVSLPFPLFRRMLVGDGSIVRLDTGDRAPSDNSTCMVQLWSLRAGAALGEPYAFPLLHEISRTPTGSFELELLGEDAYLVDVRHGTHRHMGTHVTEFHHWIGAEFLSLFTDNGALVAIPTEDGVHLLDTATGAERGTFRAPGCAAATQVAFGPGGQVVVGTRTGTVCVFDRASQSMLRTWTLPPRSQLFADATLDQDFGDIPLHAPQISLLAFAGGGRGLVVGSDNGAGPSGAMVTDLFDLSTGKLLSNLDKGSIATHVDEDASGTVWLDCAAIAPNLEVRMLGDKFASGRHWKCLGDDIVSDGLPIPVFEGATDATFLSADPTGSKVLGSVAGRARVWSLKTGKLLYAP